MKNGMSLWDVTRAMLGEEECNFDPVSHHVNRYLAALDVLDSAALPRTFGNVRMVLKGEIPERPLDVIVRDGLRRMDEVVENTINGHLAAWRAGYVDE